MSLLRLLADFPNYSARKVRRLANQLKWLDQNSDPQAKNIAADLMDYNVQSAQLEERLNDDVKVEMTSDPNCRVVSLDVIQPEIEAFILFVKENSDIRLNISWEDRVENLKRTIREKSFDTNSPSIVHHGAFPDSAG